MSVEGEDYQALVANGLVLVGSRPQASLVRDSSYVLSIHHTLVVKTDWHPLQICDLVRLKVYAVRYLTVIEQCIAAGMKKSLPVNQP